MAFRTRRLLLAAPMLTVVMLAPWAGERAHADGLADRATYWGKLHGAGIYCRRQDTDTFGRKAVDYMRRIAGSQGEFENARNKYGVAAVQYAQKPPAGAVGGSCAAATERYREALGLFSGG